METFESLLEKGVTRFLDVDGIAVVSVSGTYYGMSTGDGLAVPTYPYYNDRKVYFEGDDLTRAEFEGWLKTGKNKFDVG